MRCATQGADSSHDCRDARLQGASARLTDAENPYFVCVPAANNGIGRPTVILAIRSLFGRVCNWTVLLATHGVA